LATVEHLRSRGEVIDIASYDGRMIAAAQAMGISIARL
jgi:hypothetical protein